MCLQVLSDDAVGFRELGLLQKNFGFGEKRFRLLGRLGSVCGSHWNYGKKKAKEREEETSESFF